jgi:hypothetical protein
MSFVTKLIVSSITIGTAIIASLWGAFEIIDSRMDKKVSSGEERVMALVATVRNESDIKVRSAVDEADLKLKIVDTRMFTELNGLKGMVGSMDNKLNILLSLRKTSLFEKYGKDGSYVTLKEAKK